MVNLSQLKILQNHVHHKRYLHKLTEVVLQRLGPAADQSDDPAE